MYSVLFVCTDNFCRSPTAQAVLQQKIIERGWQHQVQVDSAGTHDYQCGEPVDFHALKHAMRRGYEMSMLRARLLQAEYFDYFDLILAMDDAVMRVLQSRCPPEHQHKLRHFTAFCSDASSLDVPDPFYGQAPDFEQVLDLVEDGCEQLMAQLEAGLLIEKDGTIAAKAVIQADSAGFPPSRQ